MSHKFKKQSKNVKQTNEVNRISNWDMTTWRKIFSNYSEGHTLTVHPFLDASWGRNSCEKIFQQLWGITGSITLELLCVFGRIRQL